MNFVHGWWAMKEMGSRIKWKVKLRRRRWGIGKKVNCQWWFIKQLKKESWGTFIFFALLLKGPVNLSTPALICVSRHVQNITKHPHASARMQFKYFYQCCRDLCLGSTTPLKGSSFPPCSCASSACHAFCPILCHLLGAVDSQHVGALEEAQ